MPLREVRTFRKSIGGTATNVAVAARPPRPSHRGVHQGRRRPVRRLRPLGAGRDLRRRHPLRGRRSRPAHAARLRRARPARRPPHHLLPGTQGARHEPDELDDVDLDVVGERCPILWVPAWRAVRRAEPHDRPRPAGAAGPPRAHRARPRLAATVLGRRRPARPARSTGRSTRPRWPSATGPSARSPSARPTRPRRPTALLARGLDGGAS